jgi:hypothetical protein
MNMKYSLLVVVLVALVFWYVGGKWPLSNLPVVGQYL